MKYIYTTMSIILFSCMFFGVVGAKNDNSFYISLASSPVSYSASVSNYFYGETTEYKVMFTLPKGVEVGKIRIGFNNGNQDLSQAELEVLGLPPGESIINRSMGSSSSEMIQYKIYPAIILEDDTEVTIILKNVVNTPYNVHNFDLVPQPGPSIGFHTISIESGDGSSSVSTSYLSTARLFKRPTREVPFVTNVKFESTSDVYGAEAEHTFSFNLPKDMYVGRISFSYDKENVDLSKARVEVTGLPSGVMEITEQNVNRVHTHNFKYVLPETILLGDDTRVSFKIKNVKNPEQDIAEPWLDSYYGNDGHVGIHPQVYVSGGVAGAYGNTSFFEYNYSHELQTKLEGRYYISLRNAPVTKEIFKNDDNFEKHIDVKEDIGVEEKILKKEEVEEIKDDVIIDVKKNKENNNINLISQPTTTPLNGDTETEITKIEENKKSIVAVSSSILDNTTIIIDDVLEVEADSDVSTSLYIEDKDSEIEINKNGLIKNFINITNNFKTYIVNLFSKLKFW